MTKTSLLTFFAVVSCSSSICALTIKTKRGDIYENVTVTSKDQTTLTISSDSGVQRLSLDSLVEETIPKTLFELAEEGTPEEVRAAIKSGASVNQKDKGVRSPLMVAALLNPNPKVAITIIELGAEVNPPDGGDWTPLMNACCEGTKNKPIRNNIEVVKALIKAGAHINAHTDTGMTALMAAISCGANPEVIAELIKSGGNVNAMDSNGETPLMHLWSSLPDNSNRNVAEIVKSLIATKANINARNKDGCTALMFAAKESTKTDELCELLKSGVELDVRDKDGKTTLMYAAENSHGDFAVNALIKIKTDDLNTKDKYGKTALMYARHPDTITSLIKSGAKIDILDNEGRNALMLTYEKDAVAAFVKGGIDINAVDAEGLTPLGLTLIDSRYGVAGALIESGADVNKIINKRTPLMWAVLPSMHSYRRKLVGDETDEEVLAVVKALLKSNAKVNARGPFGLTALIFTAQTSNRPIPNLIKLLVDAGADLELQDTTYGGTALMHAAASGNIAMVKELIGNGANTKAQDKRGRTYLDYASLGKDAYDNKSN